MPKTILAMVSSTEELIEGIWKHKHVGCRVRLGALKALRSHLDAIIERAEQEFILSQALDRALDPLDAGPKEERQAG